MHFALRAWRQLANLQEPTVFPSFLSSILTMRVGTASRYVLPRERTQRRLSAEKAYQKASRRKLFIPGA